MLVIFDWESKILSGSGSSPHLLPLQVFNRKTNKVEERHHVWVATGFKRENYEEDKVEKSTSFKKSFKDPTDAQMKEATLKVASFVPWSQERSC